MITFAFKLFSSLHFTGPLISLGLNLLFSFADLQPLSVLLPLPTPTLQALAVSVSLVFRLGLLHSGAFQALPGP